MPATPPLLAFDIETVPDTAALRQKHGYPDDLSDAAVVEMTQRLLRQEKNSDFFPHHQQRVATISCLLRKSDEVQIFSLPVDDEDPRDEAAAINLFFRIIDKYEPFLISWNGGGFDLPVLHYRGMKHSLVASTYWNTEDHFKWNHYTNRYHERHTDLMDRLALYQPRAWAGLGDFAGICGLPGKIGIGGANVWETWLHGDLPAIRRYCETDALLTYLLFVRYQNLRGNLDGTKEEKFIRAHLENDRSRWGEFLAAWR